MKVYFTPSNNIDDSKSFMLAQHLMRAAQKLNIEVTMEVENADLIIELSNAFYKNDAYKNKKICIIDLNTAFNDTEKALREAIENAKPYSDVISQKLGFKQDIKHIVAVTACPSGVTQTFMAAEAIASYAQSQGWDVKVEARGNIGTNNIISAEDVALADLVFVATDIDVDLSKFKGKPMYHTSTMEALKNTENEFIKAFKEAKIYTGKHQANKNRKDQNTKYGKCAIKKGAHRVSFLVILAILIGLLLMYLQ